MSMFSKTFVKKKIKKKSTKVQREGSDDPPPFTDSNIRGSNSDETLRTVETSHTVDLELSLGPDGVGDTDTGLPFIETVRSKKETTPAIEYQFTSGELVVSRPLPDLLDESFSLYARHEFSAALPILEAAMCAQILERGEMHPDVAKTLKRIACCHHETGNYRSGVCARQHAIFIWKSCGDDYNLEIQNAKCRVEFARKHNLLGELV